MFDRPANKAASRDLSSSQAYKIFALILIYAFLSYLYFAFFHSGHWLDMDTQNNSWFTNSVSTQGQILPAGAPIYRNGFGYPVAATFHTLITGVPIQEYQQFIPNNA